MAFPYLKHDGFESAGTTFTSETDSGSILDYPHYTELARYHQIPWRGAYCMRIKAAGATDAYIQENSAFDTALGGTIWFRWYFYLGKNFVMTNGDKFSMVELESTLDTTTEVAAGIDRNGSNIRFWVSETAAAAAQTLTLGTTTTALGKWFHAEIKAVIASAAPGSDGTIDAYIDDGVVGSQITTLAQAAIVDAKFGLIGADAGTSGTLLMDDIIADEAQVFSDTERWKPQNRWVHALNDHPVIGPGAVSVMFTDTAATSTCSLYDTDGVSTRLEPIVKLRNASANEDVPGHDIFEFNHGLYVVMTGTNPEAFVSVERGGVWSEGALIARGVGQRAPKP